MALEALNVTNIYQLSSLIAHLSSFKILFNTDVGTITSQVILWVACFLVLVVGLQVGCCNHLSRQKV